jgi:glycosyltransferase involved in cell wall biosynthesis
MKPVSIVIICRNEASIIGRTLESCAGVTDDIVVYDSGSTDDTKEISRRAGARLVEGEWKGYGLTKKIANSHARYDWILSLDADESLSNELKAAIASLQLSKKNVVYELKFRNFIGEKALRFGEWGGDRHIRLFNREAVNWDEAPVHEQLILPRGVKVETLKGHILHYTARTLDQYEKKLNEYARLNAEKYRSQGRGSNWMRRRFSGAFSFITNYIFKLGFLDGKEGYQCARMTARYTYMKYEKLRELGAG